VLDTCVVYFEEFVTYQCRVHVSMTVSMQQRGILQNPPNCARLKRSVEEGGEMIHDRLFIVILRELKHGEKHWWK